MSTGKFCESSHLLKNEIIKGSREFLSIFGLMNLIFLACNSSRFISLEGLSFKRWRNFEMIELFYGLT